jgi:cytochrome P450
VGTSPSEIITYPIVPAVGITVDPLYKDLQRRGPVRVQLPFGEPCWLATRYDDVKTVYGDRVFGRRLGLEHDPPGLFPGELVKDPNLLLNMDPPEQTRIRRLTSSALSPARIQALEGWTQEVVDGLFDEMVSRGQPADFVSLFSSNLPVLVLSGILGIRGHDTGRFAALVETLVGPGSEPEQRGDAHEQIRAFVTTLIAERREQRSDDLLSALVEARDEGDRLSEAELFDLCLALWLGGVDTTHNELGSMVYALMTHPDHWHELVEDPALVPAALEELWRWIPSHQYGAAFARWPSEDVELSGGTMVRAGEPVMPEHTVANRDDSVYPNGWELDFHRVDPPPHLTFAFGPHHCMGAHLARLEVKVAIETLVRRFPTLQLAVPADDVEWSTTSMLRSVVELPLTW